MFHSLGAPDLDHYSMDGLYPVSSWGLMEFDSNPPRHMGAFMKWRYGTWISTLPPITNGEGEKPYMSTIIENGTYSLNPLTSNTNNCYKIASPNSTTEYFLVEYRKSVGTFENSLPGEGLLVYRINSNRDGLGNRNGPPDEVYIYRPGGTTSLNGDPDSANFSSDVGRTAINDSTDPSSFLSDGSAGGLNISNVTSVGSTISFTVTFTGGGTQTLTVQSQPASGASITVSPTDGNGQGNGATPFTRTYATGTAVTLTPAASFNGLPFMNWTLDGVVQTRENSSPEDLQNANELVVTMGSAHTAVANYGISIGQAVDNTSLTWTTGGDGGGWYGQTTTSHDGVDAAQNYDISHNQSNWVQTTVQGPGNLSFWWKASSELNYDGTIFYIDGAVQTSIHGNTAWRQETYPIAAGAHTLKWLYTKDGSIDFGSDAGWLDQVVYTTTATTWQQLTTVNPEGTITANTDGDTASEIIADFGSAWGLWHWNGGSWSELTSSSPEYVVSGDTDGDGQAEIVGDFGPGTGLYLWNGSWSQLTASDPDKVITGDVDNDGRAEVFGDFGSMGFWQWDSGWTQLTAADADNMIAADTDGNGDHEIVVDFGASGVWQRDGNAWTQLVASNPETMISGDLDGDGRAEIIADFGPLGLWQWNSQSGWSQLVGSDVEGMVCGDLDGNGDQEIVGDFGSLGLWQWNGGSGWSQLVGSNVEEAVCGDVDGDGRDEVIGDFGSLGVWTLSDSGWVELSSSDPDALLCADTDGTGDEEIIGDFGAQGLWLR
jgi:hypothetical protein